MKKTLWGGNQPNTLLLAPMNAHTWELSDVSENPRGCMQCIRACKNLFHQKGSVCLLTVMERKLRRYLTKILQGGCALTPPLYYTASEQPHSTYLKCFRGVACVCHVHTYSRETACFADLYLNSELLLKKYLLIEQRETFATFRQFDSSLFLLCPTVWKYKLNFTDLVILGK